MTFDMPQHETPPTWDRRKIKFHLSGFFGGGTPSKDNLEYWTDATVPWVTPKDMKRRMIDTAEDLITVDAVKNSATNMVPPNSVLMVVRSGILKHSLPVALTTVPVALNQDMKAFRFRRSLLPEFFAYWIEGQQKQKLLEWCQIGATVDNINVDAMLNGQIAVPDLATQRQIADFLDRETARIDLLIEKKQRLVALLGDHWDRFTFDLFSLDTPTRFELDKSGWQHQKLKFLSPQVTVGIVVTPAAYYTDDGVPAIRGTNIRAMDLRLDDMVSITDEGHRINRKSAVAEGDVVVVRTGQPGTAAVVPKALDGANCIDVILIKKSKKYHPYLLAHFLNSSAAKAQYSSGSSGAIQQHFNISIASNLVVPVPPVPEQGRVLAILRQEGQRVRNLTSTLQTGSVPAHGVGGRARSLRRSAARGRG